MFFFGSGPGGPERGSGLGGVWRSLPRVFTFTKNRIRRSARTADQTARRPRKFWQGNGKTDRSDQGLPHPLPTRSNRPLGRPWERLQNDPSLRSKMTRPVSQNKKTIKNKNEVTDNVEKENANKKKNM